MPHVQTRKYRRGYLVLKLIHIDSFQHNTKTHLFLLILVNELDKNISFIVFIVTAYYVAVEMEDG